MTSYVSPVAFTTVAQSIPPNVFAEYGSAKWLPRLPVGLM